MNKAIQPADFKRISKGYNPNPSASLSLNAEAYTSPDWYASDVQTILAKSWQWVCHSEKIRKHGAYTTAQIAGQPIVVLRDKDGALRAFYNVCKHRAHQLLDGDGQISRIMCPYHAWTYDLNGQLARGLRRG